MVQVRSWDPVEAREALPPELRDWHVEGAHWLWDGSLTEGGYARSPWGGSAARAIFVRLVFPPERRSRVWVSPEGNTRILEHKCEFKHCVYPGCKLYQNERAFDAKWNRGRSRRPRPLPEQVGKGCEHSRVGRDGCAVCDGWVGPPHESLPMWVTGSYPEESYE